MKASELKKRINELVEEFGDFEIFTTDTNQDGEEIVIPSDNIYYRVDEEEPSPFFLID